MAEAIVEKVACANCGADVRPGTLFCYSCGRSVITTGPEPVADAEASSDSLKDLEAALAASRIEQPEKSKIESAAAERRKARVAHRKSIEIVWEPAEARPAYFIAAVAIFLFVVLVLILSRSAV